MQAWASLKTDFKQILWELIASELCISAPIDFIFNFHEESGLGPVSESNFATCLIQH